MFRGSYVALITPFKKNSQIDWKKAEELVAWQIASGTDGIVCGATTGEGPTLSDRERKRLGELCIKTAGKRAKVIVSTGVNDTKRSVKATEEALKLGADGCLAVTPYYNRPTQRGCVLHYQEIGKVGLPIIVYHNPPRTNLKLAVDTVEQLSRIPNLVGFKDSSADIEFVRNIRKVCPDLSILSGDDDMTGPILQAGGDGVIGVISNVIPEGWGRAVHLGLAGRWEIAGKLFNQYLRLCKAHFLETNPQCVKHSMAWLGKCSGKLRLPMVEPLESTKKAIQAAILTSVALPQFTVQPARSGSVSCVS